MVTPQLYAAVLLAAVALRLVELRVASRNTAALRAAGAIEVGAAHYPVMVVLHAAFLGACAVEGLVVRPTVPAVVQVAAAAALIATIATRWWVIRTLGDRWTTRVLWVPGSRRIVTGPFRFVRHPNYLAVVVELLALPLLGGAWRTAVLFAVANGVLLLVRVRVEDDAMRRLAAP
jgi:methyltransferase